MLQEKPKFLQLCTSGKGAVVFLK